MLLTSQKVMPCVGCYKNNTMYLNAYKIHYIMSIKFFKEELNSATFRRVLVLFEQDGRPK